MGLDQYLQASKYVSGYKHHDDDTKAEYKTLAEMFGVGEYVDPDSPSASVEFTVAYWRKANQIHQWFVENVQDGVDECKPHYVSREQLAELRDLCKLVLGVRTKVGVNVSAADRVAAEKLPPISGFFFGSEDIDEWYWAQLTDTVKQIDRVLTLPEEWSLKYQSSW